MNDDSMYWTGATKWKAPEVARPVFTDEQLALWAKMDPRKDFSPTRIKSAWNLFSDCSAFDHCNAYTDAPRTPAEIATILPEGLTMLEAKIAFNAFLPVSWSPLHEFHEKYKAAFEEAVGIDFGTAIQHPSVKSAKVDSTTHLHRAEYNALAKKFALREEYRRIERETHPRMAERMVEEFGLSNEEIAERQRQREELWKKHMFDWSAFRDL